MVTSASFYVVAYALLLATPCSSFSFSSSSSPQNHENHLKTISTFTEDGITSILALGDGVVLAGTRAGAILQSNNSAASWSRFSGYNSKYPVYSLAIQQTSSSGRIFCGGGDRHVSIWDSEDNELVQRIGPHTGWVKALAFDENTKVLFSIGCNCIEAWDCAGPLVSHLSKRSVDNSVSASTLSSDLLSLCLVGRSILVSSGVDGRLHVWSTDVSVKEPLFEVSPHTGRVNAMVYSVSLGLLFSVGNDGRLCALKVSLDSIVLKSELILSGLPRLSTALVVAETDDVSSSLSLALGTSEGQIIDVTVSYQHDTLTMVETGTVDIGEKTRIYGLGMVHGPSTDKRVLLIGAANGMSKLKF